MELKQVFAAPGNFLLLTTATLPLASVSGSSGGGGGGGGGGGIGAPVALGVRLRRSRFVADMTKLPETLRHALGNTRLDTQAAYTLLGPRRDDLLVSQGLVQKREVDLGFGSELRTQMKIRARADCDAQSKKVTLRGDARVTTTFYGVQKGQDLRVSVGCAATNQMRRAANAGRTLKGTRLGKTVFEPFVEIRENNARMTCNWTGASRTPTLSLSYDL